MTELERLEYSKTFIDKLANGINPITGETIPDKDTVNDVRIVRCLFYVSDVLRQVVENGGVQSVRGRKNDKVPFWIDYKDRGRFQFSSIPITISELAKRINDLLPNQEMSKLTYKPISDWLVRMGLISLDTEPSGKTIRRPTAAGLELGISTEERSGQRGPYTVVVYSKAAQEFILDNLDGVIECSRKKITESPK